MVLPKTFNNCFGFERGLWRRQSGCFEHVPKTSDFAAIWDTGLFAVPELPGG